MLKEYKILKTVSMMGVMNFIYLNNRFYFFLIFDIFTQDMYSYI